MKYRQAIYNDVIEYFKENFGDDIDQEQVDKMSNKDVLDYYLQWNGIIGYTGDIACIMQAHDELYTKQDVMNELIAYIGVLKHDINGEQDKVVKHILNNVIYSLNEIVNNFNH